MKHLLTITTLSLTVSLLLSACVDVKNINTGSKHSAALKINNLILEELHKQDFDSVITIFKDSKYYIDATINDRTVPMVVDTGSSYSLMRSRFYRTLKLEKIESLRETKLKVKLFFDDIVEAYPAKADLLKVGALTFNPWPFLMSDDCPADAILGCEFLHITKAVFICNTGVLCMTIDKNPARGLGDILKNYSYKEIDLLFPKDDTYIDIQRQYGDAFESLESGLLFVPVTFNDTSGSALIDTGSVFTFLDSSKFDETTGGVQSYSGFICKDSNGNEKTLASINLYRFLIDGHAVSDHFKAAFMEMKNRDYSINKKHIEFLGVIGLDILVNHNAIIDFGNRKLYLQK